MQTSLPSQRNKEFGQKLYLRRNAIGITREELAQRVGTTALVVTKWEEGARTPHIYRLAALAIALGTTTDDLLRRKKKQ